MRGHTDPAQAGAGGLRGFGLQRVTNQKAKQKKKTGRDGAGRGITPNFSTLNLKVELLGEGAVGRGLLPPPAHTFRGQKGDTSQAWCEDSLSLPRHYPSSNKRRVWRHSRLRSAAPPPLEGPPFGHYSCLEMANPNSLGRRGKMPKKHLKTRERREAAVPEKKPAPPQNLPWRSAGTAKSEFSCGTDTNCLSTVPAPNPEAPPPPTRNPPRLLEAVCSIPRRRVLFRGNQSDVSQFTLGSSLLLRKAPFKAWKARQPTTTPRIPHASLHLPVPPSVCALPYGICRLLRTPSA